MGSLQKTPSKKERRASGVAQERSQRTPKDDEDQPVPRALTFEDINKPRGPKPLSAARDVPDELATAIAADGGTAVVDAPVRAKSAVGRPPRGARTQVPAQPKRKLVRAASKASNEKNSPMSSYVDWRKMQYSMNWRMLLLLRGVANMSLLRLTDPDVPLQGKDIVEIADNDPNPDADVKFMATGAYRVAPDSILRFYGGGGAPQGDGGDDGKISSTSSTSSGSTDARASSRAGGTGGDNSAAAAVDPVLPWCLLIGCPGHISIGILWPQRGKRAAYVEHFDSRGINESLKAGGGSYTSLPHIREYFRTTHGVGKLASVNAVDFQEVELDVFCQTWIFYFVWVSF
jgi:hypothetical protein